MLQIANLEVAYRSRGRDTRVVRDLSLHIGRGEAYGLVGESGCGKSTTALAVVRYLPRGGRVLGGRILLDGQDLLALDKRALRQMRARHIAMVYQDPARALNPSIPIGRQLAEVFILSGLAVSETEDRAVEMLRRVRISDPAQVMARYPHQLSGGMLQRVVIAMALAVDRRLLILDEPTTGLDATVEAEVLDLIETLRAEFSTSVLFIGHNLGVIARMCARVGVLYAGAKVEEGPTARVFEQPQHPYTVGLLRCLPRRGRTKRAGPLDTIPGFLATTPDLVPGCVFSERCGLAADLCHQVAPELVQFGDRFSRCHFHERAPDLPRGSPSAAPDASRRHPHQAPVLRVENLSKTYSGGQLRVAALRDIAFELWPGETLGLVGESGSGKTTLARVLLGLTPPDDKSIVKLDGEALPDHASRRRPEQLKALQIVFQNPDSALNRSHSVRRIIGRALHKLAGLRGDTMRIRLLALTRSMHLADRFLGVRPRQLSGGLKQRVAIARAFAGEPRLVVCDEPTSALDVSVQAAILNLLADLQVERQVSYLFISHDLGVVRYLADRLLVLYLGRVMEAGPAERVFEGPHHPYTEALFSAAPDLQGRGGRILLAGEMPSATKPPRGCVFHTRCPRKLGRVCEDEEPSLSPRDEEGHAIRCHLPTSELAGARTNAAATA
ncbi:MAG TPA: ABC transporter ATP-binding protein [Xanthobacteraceae bacterium]|nr:ABC transporter ATP-binding protein [Xanthobacteraceae bacterium]